MPVPVKPRPVAAELRAVAENAKVTSTFAGDLPYGMGRAVQNRSALVHPPSMAAPSQLLDLGELSRAAAVNALN